MSPSRTLPATGDQVSFSLKLDGQTVPRRYQVSAITTTRELGRIPSASIRLLDGDPARGNFPASDSDLFVPGKQIEILLGYGSDERSVFDGLIVKQALRARQGAGPSLQIECRDATVKMTLERRSRYFQDTSDSDMASQLIDEYGLRADLAATPVTHAELVQFEATDWDFLLSRLEANGLLCLAGEGKLAAFAPDTGQSPALELEYGATVLAFDTELDARDQPGTVNGHSWDPAAQEPIAMEAAAPGTREAGNLSAAELAAALGQNRRHAHGGHLSGEETQTWVDARRQRDQLAKLRARVSFQGLSAITPGQVVNLNRVGERFSGPLLVNGVRHRVSEGRWITDLQLGLDCRPFSDEKDIHSQPAAGLLPTVPGLQVGLVTDLEDPDDAGRVLVRLPLIDPAAEGVWARLATLDAGDERGSQFLPEIDDEVLLGFLNADPRHPVILGMLHSAAKPPPFDAANDNHEKGYVSREALKLRFHDEEKSITLETPAGNKLLLSENEGGVRIEDENGNKIVMDASGIVIESASDLTLKATGDVSVEGVNLNATASAGFTAEGSASAELSSGGTTTVKGSVVMIN